MPPVEIEGERIHIKSLISFHDFSAQHVKNHNQFYQGTGKKMLKSYYVKSLKTSNNLHCGSTDVAVLLPVYMVVAPRHCRRSKRMLGTTGYLWMCCKSDEIVSSDLMT